MLTNEIAEAVADHLDLGALPACAACLFELAWKIHRDGKAHPATITSIAGWTFDDFRDELRDQLVELRMREVLHAEEALNDVDERGFRGRFARVVVRRLAEEMAEEIADRCSE